MLEDTLEGMDDEEEMEEAAEAEVDRILYEITAGKEPGFFFCVILDSIGRPIWVVLKLMLGAADGRL